MNSDESKADRPALMNLTNACQYLGIAKATMRRWVCAEKIPFVRVGRLIKFRIGDLDAWLCKRTRGLESIDQSDTN